jgi:hypothetical protein
MAGGGDGPLAVACARGGLTGRQAQRAQALSGGLEPGAVAACGEAGDGHGALDATHRLAGLDHGGETPALDRLSECRLKALASRFMGRHGPDIHLEDQRLGGRRPAHCRQPAPRGRPPGGPARIAAILAQPEGLQAGRGGLAIPERLRTRAGAVAERLVLGRRDIDRGQLAGTHQAGERGGVTAIGLDAGAGWLRDQCGGHDPAPPLLAAASARAPGPPGPSVVDEDARWGVRGQGAEQCVNVALAGAETPPADVCSVLRLASIRHRDGLLVPIQPDRQYARVTHG